MYKWGMVANDSCSFCHQERETLTHLFYLCPEANALWQKFEKYVEEKFGSGGLSLTPKDVIFKHNS